MAAVGRKATPERSRPQPPNVGSMLHGKVNGGWGDGGCSAAVRKDVEMEGGARRNQAGGSRAGIRERKSRRVQRTETGGCHAVAQDVAEGAKACRWLRSRKRRGGTRNPSQEPPGAEGTGRVDTLDFRPVTLTSD